MSGCGAAAVLVAQPRRPRWRRDRCVARRAGDVALAACGNVRIRHRRAACAAVLEESNRAFTFL
ncbi:hypothetical protein [Burkholderia pseudomallei]|uniref:hypothetical protein n=1 Tax=Burkholderia pseudomallei TaxID=28450 RepID=UPI0009B1E65A|nr:hypothetical protein [Burkholderia pseudomallei]